MDDFLKGQAGLDYGEEGEADLYGDEDSDEDPEAGDKEDKE